MSDFSWGGAFDSFTELAEGYLGLRTAEAAEDAKGTSQAKLNTSVETPTTVGNTPVASGQYKNIGQAVGTSANTTETGNTLPFNLTQNQLLMGAAFIAAILIFKK